MLSTASKRIDQLFSKHSHIEAHSAGLRLSRSAEITRITIDLCLEQARLTGLLALPLGIDPSVKHHMSADALAYLKEQLVNQDLADTIDSISFNHVNFVDPTWNLFELTGAQGPISFKRLHTVKIHRCYNLNLNSIGHAQGIKNLELSLGVISEDELNKLTQLERLSLGGMLQWYSLKLSLPALKELLIMVKLPVHLDLSELPSLMHLTLDSKFEMEFPLDLSQLTQLHSLNLCIPFKLAPYLSKTGTLPMNSGSFKYTHDFDVLPYSLATKKNVHIRLEDLELFIKQLIEPIYEKIIFMVDQKLEYFLNESLSTTGSTPQECVDRTINDPFVQLILKRYSRACSVYLNKLTSNFAAPPISAKNINRQAFELLKNQYLTMEQQFTEKKLSLLERANAFFEQSRVPNPAPSLDNQMPEAMPTRVVQPLVHTQNNQTLEEVAAPEIDTQHTASPVIVKPIPIRHHQSLRKRELIPEDPKETTTEQNNESQKKPRP